MGTDRVIVVLDRESAEMIERVTAGALIGSPTRAVNAPIRAALDRDRDELVERVAEAINKTMSFKPLTELHELYRRSSLKRAEAALAAIEEADQEEGDRG